MYRMLMPLVLVGLLGDLLDAEDRVRPAIERSLPLLERAAAGSADQRDCFTCHSQGLPVLALSAARPHAFAFDDANFQRQLEHTYAHLERNRERFEAGKGTGGNADTAGYALWTLSAGERAPDETTAAVAEYLLTWQADDPHWSCTSHRPPSEASDYTTTYVALRGLKAYATEEQQERVESRIASVREWLHSATAEDNEDRVFRLRGLHLVESKAELINVAADDLLSRQQEDGSWSQLDDQPGDAYATATALAALYQTETLPVTDARYQQGVSFLLDTQQADGSWQVASRSKPFQQYFETGFPHGTDQFISTAATAWAVLALLPACPEVTTVPTTAE